MTAKEQLRTLVGELNEEQAERALAVLESSAEWVITGERSAPPPRRPSPAEHGPRRTIVNAAVGNPVGNPVGNAVGNGRHRGL